jgi:hypothetical protein
MQSCLLLALFRWIAGWRPLISPATNFAIHFYNDFGSTSMTRVTNARDARHKKCWTNLAAAVIQRKIGRHDCTGGRDFSPDEKPSVKGF